MQTNSPIYLIGLDRDGTINQDEDGYLGRDEDWKESITFCPKALEGLRLLRAQPDFKIIVASNQAGVARNYFSVSTMDEVEDHIKNLLNSQGIKLDAWICCAYVDEEYAKKINMPEDSAFRVWVKKKGENHFRKPGIGMLESALIGLSLTLKDFLGIYFVGDKRTDVQTGLNAGGYGVLVSNEKNPEELTLTQELSEAPEYKGRILIASDLLDAVEKIIGDTKMRRRN